MFNDLQDYVSLLGADDVGNLARFHGESFVFQFFGQRSTLEDAEVAALSSRRAVGIFLGDVLELAPL